MPIATWGIIGSVNGKIYFKMFNDAKYPTNDFKVDDEQFEFKVKIPK